MAGTRWLRRDFLQAAGGCAGTASLGAFFSACQGAAAPPAASTAPASPPPAAVAPAPTSSPASIAPSVVAPASPSAVPSGGLPTLSVAYPSLTGNSTPVFMADALGLFPQHGVNVTLEYLQGDVGTAAIVAKQIDVLIQAPTPMITGDVNAGLDLVYFGSFYNHNGYALEVAPSISSPNALKGQPVGSDKPGTSTDFVLQLLLGAIGLQESDVEVRIVGNGPQQVAALVSGQVAAVPVAPPDVFAAEAQGFHALIDAFNIPYQSAGVIASRARLDALTPALLPFLAACREGIQTFFAQKDLGMQVLQRYTGQTDPSILKQTYEFYSTRTPLQADLQPSLEGIQAILDSLAGSTLPAATGLKAEQFVDTRILQLLGS